MDQTITGATGITSGEAFGSPALAHMIQMRITGATGIPSGEAFSQTTGVFVDPFSVPYGIWLSY